ncbi:MAG: hypothetical protein QM581_11670 [Pseudomonas sp.]
MSEYRISTAVLVAWILLALGLVALSLLLMFQLLPPLLFPPIVWLSFTPIACLISLVLFVLCLTDRSKSWWLRLSPLPFAVGMLVFWLRILASAQWH